MPPRNRPTAFDLSFGEASSSSQPVALQRGDAANNSSPFARPRPPAQPAPPRRRPPPSGASVASSSSASVYGGESSQVTLVGTAPQGTQTQTQTQREKRRKDDRGGEDAYRPPPEKRQRAERASRPRYHPRDDDQVEASDTIVLGEDPEEDDGGKPVRMLTEFVIFDPNHGNELVSLDALEELANGKPNQDFVVVGFVSPVFANEEDAGQEDDIANDASDSNNKQRLRTTSALSYSMDYTTDDPLHIQTLFAWYAMMNPAKIYRGIWIAFFKPHKVAQLLITFATQDPIQSSRDKIRERFLGSYVDELDRRLTEEDLLEGESVALSVLEENEGVAKYEAARSSLLFRELKRQGSSLQSANKQRPKPRAAAATHAFAESTKLFGVMNIDVAVLRPENQSRTTVTPLIFKMSEGLFPEQLKLLANSAGQSNAAERDRRERRKLLDFLRRARGPKGEPVFPHQHRIHDQFWSRVIKDGIEYKVEDVVLLPANGSYPGRVQQPIPMQVTEASVPKEHMLADYFWFGQIMSIDQRRHKVHIRWFEHASKTLMQEIHNPYELFLTEICNDEDIKLIVGKVEVKLERTALVRRVSGRFKPGRPQATQDEGQYFYSFKYSEVDGSFTAVTDEDTTSLITDPPDNCPVCTRSAAQDQAASPQSIRNDEGVALRGVNYHVNDFAMFKTKDSVCMVAQIVGLNFDSRARSEGTCMLTVEPLGRMNDIHRLQPGNDQIKDERHFFLTKQTMTVNANSLIRKCRVINYYSPPTAIDEYLAESPYNFYVKYHFPSLEVTDWNTGTQLNGRSKRPQICIICFRESRERTQQLEAFKAQSRPLRAFDPFGGVGAFGLAMQDAGCVKLTHAIEIAPSAALTIKKNSPDTIVYNQCSNRILENAVKTIGIPGHRSDLKPIESNPELSPIPPPPKPGDIDCIVAGFPCQPHSTMNMYQKATDRKSHLMLNLLSWVDFLEPRFCFFENVRGFLQYSLNSVQASRYKVTGGIKMGGLKFLVRALVTMGYQVRFGLLQAAHYGLPQTRIRFFLIAARMDQPLPNFPAPLYSFPEKDALLVKFSHGLTVMPVNPDACLTPFRHLTVADAISDLQRFDWRNPREPNEPPRIDPVTRHEIPVIPCLKGRPSCGPTRKRYHSAPRTRFQQKAREREEDVTDLQHITRVLKEDTTARVTFVPLQARADYHTYFKNRASVPVDLWEYQFADPKSAIARNGFRRGMYGRLDENGWFRTTVTNVEPTAKQSWVLNPWCKRVVTVRELARSQGFPDHFKFYCIDKLNVKTMQREIGNAVPWPLGYALGRELRDALFEDWQNKQREVIMLDSDDDDDDAR